MFKLEQSVILGQSIILGQRLCFRYIDSTIHQLSKSEISSL